MTVAAETLFAGSGEMGARMRALDWARTPLGPVQGWPQSLRSPLSILLASKSQMCLFWGPEFAKLYNDAYAPILGEKHPAALGQRGAEVWHEIWDVLGPLLRGVVETGEAFAAPDYQFMLRRHGYLEETYFDISYDPVRDETGRVGGVFCVVTETTERVIGERRLRTLRELAARAAEDRTARDACATVAAVLAANAGDVPFALLYLLDPDGSTARIAGAAGLEAAHAAAPPAVTLEQSESLAQRAATGWPLAEADRAGRPVVVDDLTARFGTVISGPWPEPVRQALVLPLARPGQRGHAGPADAGDAGDAGPERLAGFLVAGVSPRRALDDSYRAFFDLAAAHAATAVANARAYEHERQRAEALAELDRAKTAFFSNVSLEFRTPLTLLLGPIEETLAAHGIASAATSAGTTNDTGGAGGVGDGLRPRDRQNLEIAYRNGLRLLRLVNTLLDFSRIETWRAQATFERTDLAALTAALASMFHPAAERAGVRLVVDCPPLPHDTRVYVDREMWEKIVLNLISNALKFTFEGEIAVALHADEGPRTTDEGGSDSSVVLGPSSVVRPPSSVVLTVRDTGTGIPAAQLPHIFERFHRVRGARARTHEGAGIGLALVQELVRLHGGMVQVRSAEEGADHRTAFTVTLPTGAAHLPAERLGGSGEAGNAGGARPLAPTASGVVPYVEEALRWLPNAAAGSTDGGPLETVAGTDARVTTLDGRAGVGAVAVGGAGGAVPARILLADDNVDMREYLRRLLDEHWTVEAVADGAHALAVARARPPDLILTDVMMPRLDGFALLRALREDPRTSTIPIILLSARAEEEATVEGFAAGADDYLVKPFAAADLLARIRAHLTLGRRRNAAAHRAEALAREAREREDVQAVLNVALRESSQARDHALAESELAAGAAREANQQLLLAGLRQQELAEALQQAVRVRDDFLASTAHDLRTPLAAIKGYAQLLRRQLARPARAATAATTATGKVPPPRSPRSPPALKGLVQIEAAVARMTRMIGALQDAAQLQAGHVPYLDRRPTDIVALARRLAAEHGRSAERHRIRVETHAPDLVGDWDPDRLERALDNLLGNAVKYSPDGGDVVVAVAQEGREAVLRVRDAGVGIPAADRPRVFERFHRAANVVGRIGGAGIGLADVHQVVTGHGGTISVESQEPDARGRGGGSTFTMRLPLRVSATVHGMAQEGAE